jgi:hypothetical protein
MTRSSDCGSAVPLKTISETPQAHPWTKRRIPLRLILDVGISPRLWSSPQGSDRNLVGARRLDRGTSRRPILTKQCRLTNFDTSAGSAAPAIRVFMICLA